MSYKNIAYHLNRSYDSVRSKFREEGYLRRTHTLPGESVHRMQLALSNRLWEAVLARALDKGVPPVGYIRALIARDTGIPNMQTFDVEARRKQVRARERERYRKKVGGVLTYRKHKEEQHAIEDTKTGPHDAGRST
jgi:hypothetical protein